MSKSKITTIRAPEHDVPVESWECAVAGLVITAIPVTEVESGYRVTHEDSGLAVTQQAFASIPIASLFASKIASNEILMDHDLTWESPIQKIRAIGESNMDQLRDVLAKEARSIQEELVANPASVIEQSIHFGKDLC